MKTVTKERYKVLDFIIKKIGDEGREIKINYLSNLTKKEFSDFFLINISFILILRVR